MNSKYLFNSRDLSNDTTHNSSKESVKFNNSSKTFAKSNDNIILSFAKSNDKIILADSVNQIILNDKNLLSYIYNLDALYIYAEYINRLRHNDGYYPLKYSD